MRRQIHDLDAALHLALRVLKRFPCSRVTMRASSSRFLFSNSRNRNTPRAFQRGVSTCHFTNADLGFFYGRVDLRLASRARRRTAFSGGGVCGEDAS